MFELGIISDEVSSDFQRSCELIREWGLSHIELRILWDKNILQLSETELERARDILDKYALQVSAIASPIFKSPLDGKPRELEADFALDGAESFDDQLALLGRAAELCKHFDTRMIRVFTFWQEPWSKELVEAISAKLIKAAELARARDVLLVVENEPVCSVGTGKELGELWQHLQTQASEGLREHLALLWDPGNAMAAGERAYPDGYQEVRDYNIAHVHLKDLNIDKDGQPKFLPLGWGHLDYHGQLRELARDGYDGLLVLEPHYQPPGVPQEEAAYTAVTAARQLLSDVALATSGE